MSGGNSVSSSGLESGSNFCRDMDLYKFYKDSSFSFLEMGQPAGLLTYFQIQI